MRMEVNKLKFWQTEIFVVLWMSYGATYFLRKPLALIKDDLQSNFNLTSAALGWVDTSFLLPYALVSLTFSHLGDSYGPRLTLAGGLIISSVASAFISLSDSFTLMLGLLVISGAGQSLLWPAACSLLSKWYSDDSRNSIFGIFGTCCFAGGLAATGLAVWVQSVYGWKLIFIPPAIIVTFFGILCGLVAYPPEARGVTVPGREGEKNSVETSKTQTSRTSFLSLFWINLVPEVSISMFCVKAVRYALMLWLPLYFLRSLKYSKVNAGLAATAFEVGGAGGSALIGVVVDKCMKGRAILVAAICIGGSAVMLILFMLTSSWGPVFHTLFLTLAGALNCGPDILLAGSVAAEIGEREGGVALGVTGIVNGMGSLGTVLEGPMVSIAAAWFGWSSMVPLMILLSCIGAAASFRANVLHRRLSVIKKYSLEESEAV
ncbi:glucose-6-phosphate exchanger SLC37A2-like [Palaemon carinicauda]|uniref:glucose-6-phosphate exchanger SLC37A2-like n=1 Tax=Palaemon carinicauda TaxID=392227 RepID=UPI0035B58335